MLLSSFYQKLAKGYLKNLYMGDSGVVPTTLTAEGKAETLVHLNQALRLIYTRLPIKQNSALITTQLGMGAYTLSSQYAATQADEPGAGPGPFYINDTLDDPFSDRVVKILSVFDENGSEFSLNTRDDRDSVWTPTYNSFTLPTWVPSGTVVAVTYQAYLEEISGDDEAYDIPIPPQLEDAVLMYAASLVYDGMNGQENMVKAKKLHHDFMQTVDLMESKDMLNTSEAVLEDKLEERGFV